MTASGPDASDTGAAAAATITVSSDSLTTQALPEPLVLLRGPGAGRRGTAQRYAADAMHMQASVSVGTDTPSRQPQPTIDSHPSPAAQDPLSAGIRVLSETAYFPSHPGWEDPAAAGGDDLWVPLSRLQGLFDVDSALLLLRQPRKPQSCDGQGRAVATEAESGSSQWHAPVTLEILGGREAGVWPPALCAPASLAGSDVLVTAHLERRSAEAGACSGRDASPIMRVRRDRRFDALLVTVSSEPASEYSPADSDAELHFDAEAPHCLASAVLRAAPELGLAPRIFALELDGPLTYGDRLTVTMMPLRLPGPALSVTCGDATEAAPDIGCAQLEVRAPLAWTRSYSLQGLLQYDARGSRDHAQDDAAHLQAPPTSGGLITGPLPLVLASGAGLDVWTATRDAPLAATLSRFVAEPVLALRLSDVPGLFPPPAATEDAGDATAAAGSDPLGSRDDAVVLALTDRSQVGTHLPATLRHGERSAACGVPLDLSLRGISKDDDALRVFATAFSDSAARVGVLVARAATKPPADAAGHLPPGVWRATDLCGPRIPTPYEATGTVPSFSETGESAWLFRWLLKPLASALTQAPAAGTGARRASVAAKPDAPHASPTTARPAAGAAKPPVGTKAGSTGTGALAGPVNAPNGPLWLAVSLTLPQSPSLSCGTVRFRATDAASGAEIATACMGEASASGEIAVTLEVPASELTRQHGVVLDACWLPASGAAGSGQGDMAEPLQWRLCAVIPPSAAPVWRGMPLPGPTAPGDTTAPASAPSGPPKTTTATIKASGAATKRPSTPSKPPPQAVQPPAAEPLDASPSPLPFSVGPDDRATTAASRAKAEFLADWRRRPASGEGARPGPGKAGDAKRPQQQIAGGTKAQRPTSVAGATVLRGGTAPSAAVADDRVLTSIASLLASLDAKRAGAIASRLTDTAADAASGAVCDPDAGVQGSMARVVDLLRRGPASAAPPSAAGADVTGPPVPSSPSSPAVSAGPSGDTGDIDETEEPGVAADAHVLRRMDLDPQELEAALRQLPRPLLARVLSAAYAT